MADASVTFDTKFDGSKFQEGIDSMGDALKTLSASVKSIAGAISALVPTLGKSADATAEVSKGMGEAAGAAQETAQAAAEIAPAAEQAKEAAAQIAPAVEQSAAAMQGVAEELAQTAQAAQAIPEAMNQAAEAAGELPAQTEAATRGLTNTVSGTDELTQAILCAITAVSQMSEELGGAGEIAVESQKKTTKETKRLNSELSKTGRHGRSAASGMEKLAGRLKKMVASVFVFALISKGLQAVQKYMSVLLKTNAEFASSVSAIKTNLAVAFQPIYEAILPALNALMSSLSAATAYIAAFINALFGKTVSESKAAATALNAQAEALEDTGGAAKKAGKFLAGFDKINQASEDSGGGGGAGGQKFSEELAAMETPEIDTSALEKFEGIIAGIKAALEPTVTALGRLWDALRVLGGFAWQGLVDFYKSFLEPVGKWFLGEGLPRFIDAIKDGIEAVDWGKINTALNDFWQALAPFAINVGEGLLWLWENILVPLGTWTMNEVVPRFLDILTNALDFINTTIDAVKPGLQWIWDKFLLPIAEWTGGVITDVLDLIAEKLKDATAWVSENKDTIDTALKNIGDGLCWLWNEILKPILDGIWEMVKDVVGHVFDILGGVIKFITGVFAGDWDMAWEGIKQIFEGLWGIIETIVVGVWEAIKEVWSVVAAWFDEKVVTPIKEFFTKVWDDIALVFEFAWTVIKAVWGVVSDWFTEKVIDPIKNGFAAGINFLIGLAEGFVNGFIKGINFIINALNKLSFDIPDWVPVIGGGSFGLSIPTVSEISIPRLANGGLIRPNNPRTVIVGDNRREEEIVSPRSAIREEARAAIREVLEEYGGLGGGDQTAEIILELDGQKLGKAVVKFGDRERARRGVRIKPVEVLA